MTDEVVDELLIDTLKQIIKLPDNIREHAMVGVMEKWGEHPLIQEVVAGHTTFEASVEALTDVNAKLSIFGAQKHICDTEEFTALAESTRSKFLKILPLKEVFHGRYGSADVFLTKPTAPDGIIWRTGKYWLAGTILFLVMSFFLYQGIGLRLDPDIAVLGSIVGFLGLTLFLTFAVSPLRGYMIYLSDRKRVARNTLADAQFLDAMFSTELRRA